ncbi:proteasome complex subunit Rpn13 ubiquitin receptor-domain-containing protein [Kockovaella imperatae]|uniref:Proteasome complex subunit Rpn13 ubiquitin receptor-domain-containing protein n=1 Tax=Kockovaella imperatae TaxID=4999 RepID=A0A1Y1UL82_9TREE|nr:proteasome complex subunit Rpn13 ubiquitin receptor-domain-containing protein [Kockovaella imperatae]XP_021871852.1 proteasome complex subunit Rpn13 ubiquitin receptor-domain-containing protein [Kockovaella imperatae]ORX33233.1 proteasome complex subunit Rpn13 ubiquitin receptor-domain-containing protein [Kockovaella imperatae]ORX37865.1 proteasome complex subunit Rpn13 ubiquitin receptor-domain-containing protein [Kockovaella imperatae]
MPPIVSIPAGRSLRRHQHDKWVDASPDKGLIEMYVEDDLMHFAWKNRQNGLTENDLIIFPGEATFEKVPQDPSGRTCILKFSSSDQKYFFWFQRRSTESDVRDEVDINELLQDPSYQPGSAPLPDRPTTSAPAQEERSHPPTPGAPRLSNREPGPPIPSSQPVAQASGSSAPASASGATATNEEMARLLVEWAQNGGLGEAQEDARLTDVLSPANISSLLSSNPRLATTLAPLLPSGLNLPSEPKASDLTPILTAPQFTDAIASLDNALRSGGLPGGMMRDLGLPESAGQGVRQFLDALRGLERKEGEDDRMQED